MVQVVAWVVTGWIAGWTMRRVMRRRGYGVVADSVTGILGAMLGGSVFRRLGVVAPDNLAGHVFVALVGAGVLIALLSALRRMWFNAAPGVAPQLAGDLDAQVRRLGEVERRVLASVLGRRAVSVEPNRAFDTQLTFGERVADRVATFGGSWAFIGLFFATMIGWMVLNQEVRRPFDPYPYILLNLVLSCLAALQAPVIMMSQNRQAAKDRFDARNDYEVNVRAELQIMALHEKLDAARAAELAPLAQRILVQGEQLARLEEQIGRLGTSS
jgi:uncharacterized membrane protein/uncharacterized membrane protein YeaQ/YmgE (transglycosylase-associated protein family)